MDAVPLRELRHDEQSDPSVRQQAGHVDLVGVGEQGVHTVLLADRHAQPAVLDLDGEPRGHEVGPEQDLGVRGGEHRGVLDQFGQQVDDVGDGVSAQGAVDGRHELDPRVLLDLRDGRTQHLGHGDRVAPLPAGYGAAEHRQVLGMAADSGGEMVDMEEALEQVGVLDLVLQLVEDGDLAVDQRLESPGEVDEDLELLFAARLAGELGGLDDGGDGPVLGAGQIGGEPFEVVGALGRTAALLALRRTVAAPQCLDEGSQIGLATRAAAAECADPVTHCLGGAVGGHRGDQDARHGHRERAGEHAPQGETRPGSGGAHDEQYGRTGTEAHGDGRQHGQTQELGPYMGLGQHGRGAGGRAPVPPALTAVCACGRGAEWRHRGPRTGPSVGALGVRVLRGPGHAPSRCRSTEPTNAAPCRPTDTDSSRLCIMCGGQLTKSRRQRPALV